MESQGLAQDLLPGCEITLIRGFEDKHLSFLGARRWIRRYLEVPSGPGFLKALRFHWYALSCQIISLGKKKNKKYLTLHFVLWCPFSFSPFFFYYFVESSDHTSASNLSSCARTYNGHGGYRKHQPWQLYNKIH